MIKIIYGVQEADIEFEGKVQDLQSKISPLFNLPSNVDVKINDEWKPGAESVSENDVVEFIKPAGSKGM